MSRHKCNGLFKIYPDLEFVIHGTKIVIHPAGYLYSLPGQSDCFIGLQKISDKADHFRLGTIFLRNFYTGLDFEHNMIAIGLNLGTPHAQIFGSASNPNDPNVNNGPFGFVIAFMSTMVLVAIIFFYKSKQSEKQRQVTFAKSTASTSGAVKRYRNGVELKPSEQAEST